MHVWDRERGNELWRERMCVCERAGIVERERERVCVCERERERERVRKRKKCTKIWSNRKPTIQSAFRKSRKIF